MTTVNVAVPDVMGAFGIGQDQGAVDVVGLHGGDDRGNADERLDHRRAG
jgi:hypothetical protein